MDADIRRGPDSLTHANRGIHCLIARRSRRIQAAPRATALSVLVTAPQQLSCHSHDVWYRTRYIWQGVEVFWRPWNQVTGRAVSFGSARCRSVTAVRCSNP